MTLAQRGKLQPSEVQGAQKFRAETAVSITTCFFSSWALPALDACTFSQLSALAAPHLLVFPFCSLTSGTRAAAQPRPGASGPQLKLQTGVSGKRAPPEPVGDGHHPDTRSTGRTGRIRTPAGFSGEGEGSFPFPTRCRRSPARAALCTQGSTSSMCERCHASSQRCPALAFVPLSHQQPNAAGTEHPAVPSPLQYLEAVYQSDMTDDIF